MIRYRFQPLIEMAGSSKLITLEAVVRFEKLYKIMPQILPEEPAPLLHGV